MKCHNLSKFHIPQISFLKINHKPPSIAVLRISPKQSLEGPKHITQKFSKQQDILKLIGIIFFVCRTKKKKRGSDKSSFIQQKKKKGRKNEKKLKNSSEPLNLPLSPQWPLDKFLH